MPPPSGNEISGLRESRRDLARPPSLPPPAGDSAFPPPPPPREPTRSSARMQAFTPPEPIEPDTASFFVVEHASPPIIEIVYPLQPTSSSIAAYVINVRNAIDRYRGEWSCLVDQRLLPEVPAQLIGPVVSLNQYARQRGMKRCARVVSSAAGFVQTERVIAARGDFVMRAFTTREEALSWLRGTTFR
ncbi:MAG: hypothetical protein ACHREM_17650 [Polyangiales bacterium]